MKITFVLFFSLLILSSVFAKDDDVDNDNRSGHGRDRRDDSRNNEGRRRNCDPDVDPHRVRIECKGREGNDTTRSLIEFTTNGFPRWRVTRYRRDEGDQSRFQFTHRVGLRRVIEFVNKSADESCFVFGVDEVVSQLGYVGHSQQWGPIVQTREVVVAEDGSNATVYKFCTTLVRPANPAPATETTICMRIADAPVLHRNSRIGPTRLKFDYELRNYHYARPSGETTLALIAIVQNRYTVVSGGVRTVTIGGASGGTISWDGYVDTNLGIMEVDRSAIASGSLGRGGETDNDDRDDDDDKKQGETEHAFAFCLNDTLHPSRITWDPTVTVSDVDSSFFFVQPSLAFVFALLAFLFAVL